MAVCHLGSLDPAAPACWIPSALSPIPWVLSKSCPMSWWSLPLHLRGGGRGGSDRPWWTPPARTGGTRCRWWDGGCCIELGAGTLPRIIALNKADLSMADGIGGGIRISAKTGWGLGRAGKRP